MLQINSVVNSFKNSINPPEDLDNISRANYLKYNFRLVREQFKIYFPSNKLEKLRTEIQKQLPGDSTTPAGEFISDTELEGPQDIILMDERGRLRKISGSVANAYAVNNPSTQKIPSVSIDNSTLIYFGGIGSRAIGSSIIETEGHYKNRIGSTANTLEKIILPLYDILESFPKDGSNLPKKDRLRKLGITATYVYAYHSHRLDLEPFSDEDVFLKTLIWDYELTRLHENPDSYFGREEQIFVENVFLPRMAKVIPIQDGKFIRSATTGRIQVSGTFATQELFNNFRLTLVGYSLGSDIIHRMRNCLLAYMRDLYPEEVIKRALQQVVAVTNSGANPYLSNTPNFTTIRCVDIHDIGTLGRNPKLDHFPWRDLPVGSNRAVYNNQNEMTCWMRTPYREEQRINEGYHTEKFCMNARYFPTIARDAIVNAAAHKNLLPENTIDYLTLPVASFKRLLDKPQPKSWAIKDDIKFTHIALILMFTSMLSGLFINSFINMTT